MTLRKSTLAAHFAIALGALLLQPALASAQSSCRGLTQSKCESSGTCNWVNSYKTKSGKTVNAYCRTKASNKQGNAQDKAKSKGEKATEGAKKSASDAKESSAKNSASGKTSDKTARKAKEKAAGKNTTTTTPSKN